MKTELYIKLYGRVQGVNLRRRLTKVAEQNRLAGYVKSFEDGSIEILAQGEEEALEELLSWCQKGYFPAKITGMNFEWRDICKEYKKFKLEKNKSFFRDEAKSFYNLGKDILNINKSEINAPRHVVIIPDGNRRWAREKGWKAWIGHKVGISYDRLISILNESKSLGIEYTSFWGWSTENWDRDQDEIDYIFDLYRTNIRHWRKEFMKENFRFRHYGRKDRLPRDIVESMKEFEEETRNNTGLNFQFCLDYGGRDDLVRAINKMIKAGVGEVTEEMISEYLDTKGVPDPDLVIRTSGEKRLSGIMAYQATYAELYFTNVYFPDFDAIQFRRAILDYSGRVRRFGGTAKADLKGIDVANLKADISSVLTA